MQIKESYSKRTTILTWTIQSQAMEMEKQLSRNGTVNSNQQPFNCYGLVLTKTVDWKKGQQKLIIRANYDWAGKVIL